MSNSDNIAFNPVCAITCFEQEKVTRIKVRLAAEAHQLSQLAEWHKLLGNTTRLKILLALTQGELCVCDVAHVLELTVAATSHQLKRLRSQGWLCLRNDGKMVYYRLHDESQLNAMKKNMRGLLDRLG